MQTGLHQPPSLWRSQHQILPPPPMDLSSISTLAAPPPMSSIPPTSNQTTTPTTTVVQWSAGHGWAYKLIFPEGPHLCPVPQTKSDSAQG